MIRYGEIKRLAWRGRLSTRYYVRVYRPDGTRTWRCTGQADEDLARAQVKAWQLAAIAQSSQPTALPLYEILSRWRTQATLGRSENYRRCVMISCRRIDAAFQGRMIDSITSDDLADWIAHRVVCGDAANTCNLDVQMLRSACAWAIERGYLLRNPVTRRMHLPVPRAMPRVLTPDEEARLLAAAREIGDREYAWVLCLLTTGFRTGLVASLRWEYADLVDGLWHIPAARMKSRREYCQPIPPELLAWLRAHALTYGAIWGQGSPRWWYRIRERAGMPTLHRHDLRRTFVTRCRQAGIDIETCMDLSDHHDLRTMLAVYRRVGLDESRRALERLEAQRRERCDG